MGKTFMKTLKRKYSILLIVAFFLKSVRTQKDSLLKLSDIAPSDYDHLLPPKAADKPVEVDVNINKLSIRSIDESDMTFAVTIELWQYWHDLRLKYPSSATKKYQLLDSGWIDRIWNPKLYFINSVDGKLDNVIAPSSFFWISNESEVIHCCRVILKLTCEMNLKEFPHDHQECSIQMGSAIYATHSIILEWRKNTRRSIQLFELQQFEIASLKKSNFLRAFGPYNASCLKLTIDMRRRSGYYIINVYIPTILIVIMSMLTFWIPIDAVPARITLGVTSLLTIITKQYQAEMPSVSYIVALNVWLSSCIAFVFFSLLEFAVVIALSARSKTPQNTLLNTPDLLLPMVILRPNGTWSMKNNFLQNKEEKRTSAPRRLDLMSRIFFPVAFISFCITYWKFYS